MSQVIMYTTPVCPYCVRAKSLLAKKGVSCQEIDVSENPEIREEMIKKAGGRRTVPQIFVGEHHIGGCDDLYALEASGKLDALLTNRTTHE
jgi:glutaredoxin 3